MQLYIYLDYIMGYMSNHGNNYKSKSYDAKSYWYIYTYVLCTFMTSQTNIIQRMSNQKIILLKKKKSYFQLIISSLANEMCQRGPGDAGSILPLVGYILLYPLDTL